MATPESHCKTADVDLRILFGSVENGSGNLRECRALRSELVFEFCISACQVNESALDNPDGSGALAQSAVDVASCSRCSNAATPFIEDDSPKLLLPN
ncbi:hypothetical protein RB195_007016 [Necator americanus]|uniref:ZP domain-containing protein n=1 Tax=Necator americanus TaxID=51031 RepID=A0ABR1BV89_NECAM